jgi:hypothetical protein
MTDCSNVLLSSDLSLVHVVVDITEFWNDSDHNACVDLITLLRRTCPEKFLFPWFIAEMIWNRSDCLKPSMYALTESWMAHWMAIIVLRRHGLEWFKMVVVAVTERFALARNVLLCRMWCQPNVGSNGALCSGHGVSTSITLPLIVGSFYSRELFSLFNGLRKKTVLTFFAFVFTQLYDMNSTKMLWNTQKKPFWVIKRLTGTNHLLKKQLSCQLCSLYSF